MNWNKVKLPLQRAYSNTHTHIYSCIRFVVIDINLISIPKLCELEQSGKKSCILDANGWRAEGKRNSADRITAYRISRFFAISAIFTYGIPWNFIAVNRDQGIYTHSHTNILMHITYIVAVEEEKNVFESKHTWSLE